ncbi:MAG: polysaccharide biosynthesis C-terminal domain-containing protein [Bacteroidota bacterium]
MSIKKFASETVIYGVSTILARFLYFLLTPLYTDVLVEVFTKEEYGRLNHVFSLMGFTMIFLTYRFELAYFRFGAESKELENTAFHTSALSVSMTTILVAICLFPFIEPIANWLEYSEYVYLVKIALGIVVVDALSEIPYAKLRLDQRPIRFAAIRLTGTFINLLLNLFFILFCPYALQSEVWSFLHPFIEKIYQKEYLLAYVLIANLIGNGISLLFLAPTLFRIRWSQFDATLWKQMLQYAAPMIIVGVSYIFNELFDRLVMPYWLNGTIEENMEQVGIYGACYKFAVFLTLFTMAFRYGAEPFFFRQKNENNAQLVYAKVTKYFAIIGVIGFLVVTLYLDLIKRVVVGEEYWEGLKIVPIILLANLFIGLYYNLSVWYKVTDLTRWGAYISLVGATLTVVCNYLFLPKFGYMAAAWTTFACYLLMLILSYVFGRQKYPVPYQVGRIVGYVVFAVVLYGMSAWAKANWLNVLWQQLLLNTALLVSYGIVVFYKERVEFRFLNNVK